MAKLTILRGLPGSGKSTWAKAHANDRTVIVSADGIRHMMAGGLRRWQERKKHVGRKLGAALEGIAVEAAHNIALNALEGGWNVIADMQNMSGEQLDQWRRVADKAGAETRVVDMPDLTIGELLERNRQRPDDDRVDEAYLLKAYARTHPDAAKTNLLLGMAANPNVRVRRVDGEDDVYACNFTRDAFLNHQWDDYSSKARGLFLDHEGHVVMRGFDKFFNVGENEETSLDRVLAHGAYPVRVERKENGFLGLIGANPRGGFRYWSKSGETDYSPLIRSLFDKALPDRNQRDFLWELLLDRNVTMTVEVVDMDSDRHIIEYDSSGLYFLHCIRNDERFSIDMDAERMVDGTLRFRRPQVLGECHDRDELEKAIADARASQREGVVLYHADGYMVKVKSDHYLHVKALRTVLKGVLLNGKPTPKDDSERSRLVRRILDEADRSKLTYRRAEFNTEDVDMTYVGRLLDGIEAQDAR